MLASTNSVEQRAVLSLLPPMKIEFRRAFHPSDGLLNHFVKMKYEDSSFFDYVLDNLECNNEAMHLITSAALIEEDLDSCNSSIPLMSEKIDMFVYYKNRVIWPILRALVNRGWNLSLGKLVKKLDLDGKFQWNFSLLISTLLYAIKVKKSNIINYLIDNYSFEISEDCQKILTIFPLILHSDNGDKIHIFNGLFNKVRSKAESINYRNIGVKVLQSCTEAGIKLDDFVIVMNIEKDIWSRSWKVQILAENAFKLSNSSIFIYLLSHCPDLIDIYRREDYWYLIMQKPTEMIDYLIKRVPDILIWYDNLLSGKYNCKKDFKYKLFTENDLSNIFRCESVVCFFKKRDTFYKIYLYWQSGLAGINLTNLSLYYFRCLRTIVKFMDLYGISIDEAGNYFCNWYVSNVRRSLKFNYTCLDLGSLVLPIFMEYGYVYRGSLRLVSCNPLTRKLFWLFSSRPICLLGPQGEEILDPDFGIQPLWHLSALVIRRSIRRPFKRSIEALQVPATIKFQIQLEQELMRRIEANPAIFFPNSIRDALL